jgi:hypothetical protein
MKKIVFVLLLMISCLFSFGQTTKSVLNDSEINSKLQKIKDNIDNLFVSFKSDRRPDPEVNFDDSYFTDLKFYNIEGSTYTTDFDNNLSFRISTSNYKKATKADFEKAYTDLATNLKTVFDFLEQREKETEQTKELTLFEKGKDTNAPVASPNSPKYYISLKLKEEKESKATSYSIFLYFTSKK